MGKIKCVYTSNCYNNTVLCARSNAEAHGARFERYQSVRLRPFLFSPLGLEVDERDDDFVQERHADGRNEERCRVRFAGEKRHAGRAVDEACYGRSRPLVSVHDELGTMCEGACVCV